MDFLPDYSVCYGRSRRVPGATCIEGLCTLHPALPPRSLIIPVFQLTGMHRDLDYSLLLERMRCTSV